MPFLLNRKSWVKRRHSNGVNYLGGNALPSMLVSIPSVGILVFFDDEIIPFLPKKVYRHSQSPLSVEYPISKSRLRGHRFEQEKPSATLSCKSEI